MSQKRVILAMPTLFGIYKVIEENLKFHGFEVITIAHNNNVKQLYKSWWDRLKKIYFRDLLGDKNYKRELMFSYSSKSYYELLNGVEGQVDYCLTIWPGTFPYSFIKALRAKSKLMVHYNWEALDFLGDDFDEMIKSFDKFFFFDPNDMGKKTQYSDKLIPTTSFYFDCFNEPAPIGKSLYFLGSHAQQRIGDIRAFYAAAKELGLPIDFYIVGKEPTRLKKELALDDVNYVTFSEAMSYHENLNKVRQAGVLVDFLNTKHQGLSLRTFEAIGFEKKLITTNHTVTYYDFYHPDNIFVWNGNNHDELLLFLQKPYHKLSEQLKEKYSFGNWIRFAFDIEPYQVVGLPNLPSKAA